MALKETDEHRQVSLYLQNSHSFLQMRRIAFVAVVVSTVAVIASVVTLPMLYNYVQSFQSHLMVETDYCKTRSRDMWLEMTALQIGKGQSQRIKRGWLFGQWVPEGGYEGGSHQGGSTPSGGSAGNNGPQAGYGAPTSGGYGGSTSGGPNAGGQGYGAPTPVVNTEPTCCTCHQGIDVRYFVSRED